jgi:hypothetical protein
LELVILPFDDIVHRYELPALLVVEYTYPVVQRQTGEGPLMEGDGFVFTVTVVLIVVSQPSGVIRCTLRVRVPAVFHITSIM